MTALVKAQLGEITAGDNPTEVPGTLVDVPSGNAVLNGIPVTIAPAG